MTKTSILVLFTTLMSAAAIGVVASIAVPSVGQAHEDHGLFSAGEPGDPAKPARIINVKMLEDGKRKIFEPARIEVQMGEQVRFVLQNVGDEDHEFFLATVAENKKHAELMKQFPDMEHDDPNAKRVMTYGKAELLWKFTKRGEFEFACLIPGHYEAGMFGTLVVK
jgi:uncharacterized cupredoxin-like copper-binding protein